jgi:aminopeptidase N
MSVYQIAVVVTQMTEISSTENNKKISISARTEAFDDVRYALEHARKSLNALESYMNVTFRMPKLDKVAVPDFLFNAMENWGLITYT